MIIREHTLLEDKIKGAIDYFFKYAINPIKHIMLCDPRNRAYLGPTTLKEFIEESRRERVAREHRDYYNPSGL